jgi:5-carboxymethyl-2-hydroxymuconate isomerase
MSMKRGHTEDNVAELTHEQLWQALRVYFFLTGIFPIGIIREHFKRNPQFRSGLRKSRALSKQALNCFVNADSN